MRTAFVVVLCAIAAIPAPASADTPYFGTPVSSWAVQPMPFEALDATVSPDGKVLYVIDTLGRVLEYSTADGTYMGGWGTRGSAHGEFDKPHGIAADPYGNIWVADTGNGRVEKFSSTGKFLLSFATSQPIGIAAAGSQIYVLSGLFRAVDVRSFAGKDLGAFVATFPDGYDHNLYGNPTNSADGIATDAKGNAVVTGTMTQPLVNPDRPNCKSPLSTLPDLPDKLIEPAVATFDDKGNNLDQHFTFSPGAPCWSDNGFEWSYGATGSHSLNAVAVDPGTGLIWDDVDSDGPWFVMSSDRDVVGMWDPRFGATLNDSGASSSVYGILRTFAIGCDSTLYMVNDQRIQKVPSKTPATGHCGIRNPLLDVEPTVAPALGGAPPPKGRLDSLVFTAICANTKTCGGNVNVKVRLCPKCKPIATLKTKVKVPPGGEKLVSLHLLPAIQKRLRAGRSLTASITLGKRVTVMQLRPPVSLTATCGAEGATAAAAQSFTVNGAVSPARRGLRIQVAATGPSGEPLLLTAVTDRHGRYRLQIGATGPGAWTVAVQLPGSRKLGAAQAGCGSVVGSPPALVAAPPLGTGRQLSALDLALTCPGSAAPGQDVPVSGTLTPGDAGVPVALTFTGQPGPISAGATTADGGGFASHFVPTAPGTWTVTAQANRAGTTLTQTCTIAVARIDTSLTFSCPPGAVPLVGAHDLSGTMSPGVQGATVTVTFTPPPGSGQSNVTANGTVGSGGAYTVSFTATAAGDWTAQATWPGDAAHNGSSAPSCVVHVG